MGVTLKISVLAISILSVQRAYRARQSRAQPIFGPSGHRTTSGARQMTRSSPSEARSLFPPSLYEAEFVKARCENSFLFIFDSFWPPSGNNSPFRLWCLILAPQGSNAKVSYSFQRVR